MPAISNQAQKRHSFLLLIAVDCQSIANLQWNRNLIVVATVEMQGSRMREEYIRNAPEISLDLLIASDLVVTMLSVCQRLLRL